MFIGASDAWYGPARYHLDCLFYFLKSYMGLDIINSSSASTHVHISPSVQKLEWTKARVAGVAAASIFFESAIRAILPKSRWVSSFAQEYRDPDFGKHWNVPGYADKKDIHKSDDKKVLLQVMNKMKDTEGILGIRKLMNPQNPRTPQNGNRDEGTDRYFAWNFANLAIGKANEGVKGSIEFRRGPPSLSADDAMLWIELVAAFGLAGCAHGDAQYIAENFGIQPSDLRKYIYNDWPTPSFNPSAGKWDAVHAYQKGFKFPQLEKAFKKLANYDVREMTVNYEAKYLENDREREKAQHSPPSTRRQDISPVAQSMQQSGAGALADFARGNGMGN